MNKLKWPELDCVYSLSDKDNNTQIIGSRAQFYLLQLCCVKFLQSGLLMLVGKIMEKSCGLYVLHNPGGFV